MVKAAAILQVREVAWYDKFITRDGDIRGEAVDMNDDNGASSNIMAAPVNGSGLDVGRDNRQVGDIMNRLECL